MKSAGLLKTEVPGEESSPSCAPAGAKSPDDDNDDDEQRVEFLDFCFLWTRRD